MALTSSQIIECRLPALYNSSCLATYLTMAAEKTGQSCFGENYSLAVALRAMHMYSLDSRAGSKGDAGSVSSKREGGLSVSYAQTASSGNTDAYLSQTSFGLEYLSLMNQSCAGISLVSGGGIAILR